MLIGGRKVVKKSSKMVNVYSLRMTPKASGLGFWSLGALVQRVAKPGVWLPAQGFQARKGWEGWRTQLRNFQLH